MGLLQHTSLTVLTRWGGYVIDGVAILLVARYTWPTMKDNLRNLGREHLSQVNTVGGCNGRHPLSRRLLLGMWSHDG